MSSLDLLEKEILKYEKKGFVKERPKKLKYGSRTHLKKKGSLLSLSNDEDVVFYYVDGNATVDHMRDFFRDFEKFYKENDFLDGDKGVFVCSGTIDEKLFKELKTTIHKNEIRNATSLIAGKTSDNGKEQPIEEEKEESEKSNSLSRDIYCSRKGSFSNKRLRKSTLQVGSKTYCP